ncbi:MAG TPA: capsule assembly Wzi family protein [Chitinophaga sp.]|uniref:capsule assembly Wzi family protein n=1 Tax=Chitinophaga sp. TaxID=1869181 RepID=UPI002DBFEFCE|nr:capsule assembly Wzi family protein [Chitinophaga sp.]HEU4554244.1 capsule assembly Wzi family protein [Chitinophaga sp.]
MKRPITLLTVLLCLQIPLVHAQFSDSLLIQVSTTGTFATKDYQPLWITSQRFGAITDRKADLSTQVGFSNMHVLGNNKQFYIKYGAYLNNNDHFGKVFFQQGYIKAGYKNLELRAGRYNEIIGEVDKDLSSGSLGISGNALPIPQIGLAITNYTNVPYTNGWVQFKAMISHGWMGNHDQFIRNSWLHQKNLYIRVGKKKLKVGAGVAHFAVWGGGREGVAKIDKSFSAFWNVLLAKEANDGTVAGNYLPNRVGDHRGIVEGTIDWDNDVTGLHAYMQMPFETGQGIDIRNIDRLWGLAYTNKREGAWLQKVVGEFLYTKQMNDFYVSHVRESYYNNGIYLTGWEYQDRIIGTPLFIDRKKASEYFPGHIEPFNWSAPVDSFKGKGRNIVNNRVVGGHLGLMYTIGRALYAKTRLTFTQNYGDIQAGVFAPSRYEFYGLQEFSYQLPDLPLLIHVGLALDWGELTDNAGALLGVTWQFRGM